MKKLNLKTKIFALLIVSIFGFLILTPVKASPPPASLIIFSYTIKVKSDPTDPTVFAKECKLNGYLGGSIYANKYGATGELRPYTTCFFYMWNENFLKFYIAKPYNGLNGVILSGDKLRLKYSPVPGNIQPENINAGDACLSPWYLTDNQLTQIIEQAIREHAPNCQLNVDAN